MRDINIQGDLVVATTTVSELDALSMNFPGMENVIKEKLMFKLAEILTASNKVLFTKKQDPYTHSIIYMARIFAVDNDMVQVLRDFNK